MHFSFFQSNAADAGNCNERYVDAIRSNLHQRSSKPGPPRKVRVVQTPEQFAKKFESKKSAICKFKLNYSYWCNLSPIISIKHGCVLNESMLTIVFFKLMKQNTENYRIPIDSVS